MARQNLSDNKSKDEGDHECTQNGWPKKDIGIGVCKSCIDESCYKWKSTRPIPKKKSIKYKPSESFKIKVGKSKKLIEPDQQTITGEYVIDSHKDCKICNAKSSHRKCDDFQRSGDCLLMK